MSRVSQSQILSETENERLFQKYISTLELDRWPTSPRPYMVTMIGLPLAGKTVFARALADRLVVFLAQSDGVRRFLNSEGYTGESPVQATLEYITTKAADLLFEKRISHVFDADTIRFHEQIRQNTEKAGFDLFVIHIYCDEIAAATRLEQRRQALKTGDDTGGSHALETVRELRMQLHTHIQYPAFDFEYDSTTPIEDAVMAVAAMVNQRQLLKGVGSHN